MNPSSEIQFQHAVSLHQRGDIDQAETLYKTVLQNDPGHAQSSHMLGLLALQSGRMELGIHYLQQSLAANAGQPMALANLGVALFNLKRPAEALASLERALQLNPDFALAHGNRGAALYELGRHDEALTSYERALQLTPDSAELYYNRGNALLALRRWPEALDSFDQALRHRPDWASSHVNRGSALSQLKRSEEALAAYDHALALEPNNPRTLNNRGNALLELRHPDQALDSFNRALELLPNYAEALYNRGNALLALKRRDSALASYDSSLRLRPDNVDALNNRATALLELRRPAEALLSLDRALRLLPDHTGALNNRGNAYVQLQRIDEALDCYRRALQIDPGHADALFNFGIKLAKLRRYEEALPYLTRLNEQAPDYDYLTGSIAHAQLHCCDWTHYARTSAQIVEAVTAGQRITVPFTFLAVSDSAAAQLQCARTYVADQCPAVQPPVYAGEAYRHERIRIAYLSADFHDHATAYLMAELFERHDRQRFEITALSWGPDDQGAMRPRLQRAFDRFIDVRAQGDADVAQLMRAMEIDIAVDLKGFTTHCRTEIFAYRAAPIQVNYLGYPGTMGTDYIDYIIADRHVIPPEQQLHYAEKVVYLPDCYQPNDSQRRIAERAPTRQEVGLPPVGFVFCSFNNNYKITPAMFDCWMRLLHAVEGSVLWLLRGNAAAPRHLQNEAARRGIAPERLIFAPSLPLDDHLARHPLADLFLDTLPVNAHTTASDALWAGLPVLTCLGNAFAGRVAASLLHAVDLPELVTHRLEDYERLALALATTPARLASLRSHLAHARSTSPLFNADRYRCHLEAAYLAMWERQQQGRAPEPFAVRPIA